MTGDSSNIGCLEALAVPSTNNSAQSAPKALIPAGLYTRGCILWCIQRRNIHPSVFSVYQAVAAGHVLQSGRQAVAYHGGTCHSTCSSSITDREGAFSINILFVFLFLIIIVNPIN